MLTGWLDWRWVLFVAAAVPLNATRQVGDFLSGETEAAGPLA